jgi:AcrR family transcriptional regulator
LLRIVVDGTVNCVEGSTAARRLPREERREHLLDVAAKIVLDSGAESVTMESVAAAAGVSKGLGYAYFADRSDLLMAVLSREMRSMERRIGRAVADAEGFEDKLRAGVKAWFDTVAERGTLFGTLMSASQIRGKRARERTADLGRWEGFYADLAESELGIPRRQADVAAAILIAGLSGVVHRWVDSRDPRRLLEETFVALALDGLQGLARRE